MCAFSHCPSYLKRYISVYIINTINILYFQPVICIVIVVCVYVFVGVGYMCGCWQPHAMACMRTSEDNFPESILSPYLVLKSESFLLFLLNWLLRASRLMNVWRLVGFQIRATTWGFMWVLRIILTTSGLPGKCFFLPAEPSLQPSAIYFNCPHILSTVWSVFIRGNGAL